MKLDSSIEATIRNFLIVELSNRSGSRERPALTKAKNMDIKFTHTGAIPFNEFPEDQKFIVIRKDASVFRVVGDYLAISRQEEFMAWEPVSLTLPSSALVTRRLWLTRPNLSDSRGWGFRLYEKIQSEIRVWIKDPQFNHDFFTERNLSVGFGDVFEAVMARVPNDRTSNEADLFEVYKLRRIGNENEKFRELLDEL
ncbi:hypothetical protein [uncultured Parasutterella sp.]|uniref:hypothetical protein n=1 Tax=uncultured Parasutterella sp. TaxID=1263098 RepID=UPI002595C5D8|nr:hypothetical protein [uncultured Parasutterella sp.]